MSEPTKKNNSSCEDPKRSKDQEVGDSSKGDERRNPEEPTTSKNEGGKSLTSRPPATTSFKGRHENMAGMRGYISPLRRGQNLPPRFKIQIDERGIVIERNSAVTRPNVTHGSESSLKVKDEVEEDDQRPEDKEDGQKIWRGMHSQTSIQPNYFSKSQWYDRHFHLPHQRVIEGPAGPMIRTCDIKPASTSFWRTGRRITGAKKRILPLIPSRNVPEKIIVVLDRARESTTAHFKLANQLKVAPLTMIKKSLKWFVQNKQAVNDKDKFGIITMNSDTATWVHNFSNDDLFIKTLDYIDECPVADIFNVNAIFDIILTKVNSFELIHFDEPPNYIVRVILMYGRSITMPVITMTNEIRNLMNCPHFVFDIVMTHENPGSQNNVQKIIECLRKLGMKNYFFPIGRDAQDLKEAMTKLICHPRERPDDDETNYDDSSDYDNNDERANVDYSIDCDLSYDHSHDDGSINDDSNSDHSTFEYEQ